MIIRPELKRLHSPDVFDMSNHGIDPKMPFCVLVQAMFGPEPGKGEEAFDFLVCNPLWISMCAKEGPVFGRHHMIVEEFNIEDIRKILIRLSCDIIGGTWEFVANQLSRYGRWEFEDYIKN
jgi:hypothetical protein